MDGQEISIPAVTASSISDDVAAGPRRSGRERNSTQPAGHDSSSSLKRKRSNIIEKNSNQKRQHAQAATISKSKESRKRVTTKKTTQADDASPKLSTKSRLDSSSKDARDVIDLTGGDDDSATSSKKHKKSKAVKGEEKRLKR